MSAGSRTSSGAVPIRVVSQESTKLNGGVISAVLATVRSTSRNPWAVTTQYVDSSSANSSWPATTSRRAPPTRMSATSVNGTTRGLSRKPLGASSTVTGMAPPVGGTGSSRS